ncbi:beta-N-acetylhexosaminidase [Kribbella antibiotica]|uniref:Beta-N-acetylhexosaminidase n=2 Tax=Kribbella antibiotica TaxID=190195 RepID=A0A4R4ZRP4_9ACTN|nr:beta-N-acetylhexosaminidase [Kribbella antibiotica]
MAAPVPTQAVAGAAAAQAANPAPMVIPALREWTGGEGTARLTGRIVRDAGDAAALATTSAVFADDLRALTGQAVEQVVGQASELQAGDVYLDLAVSQVGAEGYNLAITDRVQISAPADAGVFYGTRTVLQLLKQKADLPRGSAKDWPTKPERGLMVDAGRKYFTPDFFARQIQDLAYLKMNTLHLHLTDDLGFRIESTRHPEVVSAEHLTKRQLADLIALAGRYHITVVPEIDMPGHLRPVINAHPELELRAPGQPSGGGIVDVSKPEVYAFMKDLLDEYLPLFPGPYWHIGGDEYVQNTQDFPQLLQYARARYGASANAKDSYLGFLNWANQIVRAAGKTTRAWSDGVGGGGAVTVSPDIALEFWMNHGLTAQQHVTNGHALSNQSWDPTYYILGHGRPDLTWTYETWDPDWFQGGQRISDPTRNRGSNLHVWCDFPNTETEDQVAAGIKQPLRVLSQQLWGSPKLVPTWEQFRSVIGAVGRNPQWAPRQVGNLAAGRPVTVSSVETPDLVGPYAVDSDPTSRWASGLSDNQWIQVDLGSVRSVSGVRLSWDPAYGKAYEIQLSNDGTTWRKIYATSSSDGGIDDLTGLTGAGRYVRMQGIARANQWGYSLWEFEVYGGTDLALGKPTTASSVEPTTTWEGRFATDGDGATRWSSGYDDTGWLQVDLGSVQPVNRVRLAWELSYARAYQVQVSNDGTNWTSLYSNSAADGGLDDLTGLAGSGRYVRMLGTARATQWGYSLWSFEVYS